MIDKTTVLILGAGASNAEYGLPLGGQLIQKIRELCAANGNERFHRFIDTLGISQHNVMRFVDSLRVSNEKSIDDFLQNNREFQILGKAAIAHILLICESNLKRKPSTAWYDCLFNHIVDGCQNCSDLANSNMLTVITFNYDRTLERHLTEAIATHYNETPNQVEKEMQNVLLIIHMHKQAHLLTHNSCSIDSISEKEYSCVMNSAIKQIVLIYEAETDKNQFHKITMEYENAERIIFLGFGFDKSNSELLRLDKIKANMPIFVLAYDKETKKKAEILGNHSVTFSYAKEKITDFISRSGCL